jgi:hypothetical protein
MTDQTTGDTPTPEQIAAQEQETKNQNQDQAFKRKFEKSEEEKAGMEIELKALKEGKEPAKATAKTGNEADTPDIAEMVRNEFTTRAETETKVAKAIAEFPELREHESKIREYLADASWKGIEIEQVIGAVVGLKGAMRMGAGMNAERLQSAEETGAGGGDATIEIKTEEQKQDEKWGASLPDKYKN